MLTSKKFSVTYRTVMGAERTVTVKAQSKTAAVIIAKDRYQKKGPNTWMWGLIVQEQRQSKVKVSS